jgi:hypothetical protein
LADTQLRLHLHEGQLQVLPLETAGHGR